MHNTEVKNDTVHIFGIIDNGVMGFVNYDKTFKVGDNANLFVAEGGGGYLYQGKIVKINKKSIHVVAGPDTDEICEVVERKMTLDKFNEFNRG